jgi:hypothetical protein
VPPKLNHCGCFIIFNIHLLLNFRKWKSKEKHQLFREDECAKLGVDEKVFSSTWNYWINPSDSFRNSPFQEN